MATSTKTPGVDQATGWALSADADASGLVEQAVVTHIYCWLTVRPASLGVPGQFDHHRAYRGDTIFVSPQERDRGQALGGLADPEQAAAGIAAVDQLAREATDEELSAMDAGELAGYVTQNPGEAQRVFELETGRKRGPRVTVLRAAGYDPDTLEPVEPGEGADVDATGGPSAVG
jgi:hypothetical protein